MTRILVKIILSSLVIAGVSEIGRRSSFWAAVLASIPLSTLLSVIWLYLDTGQTEAVIKLSQGIAWLLVPSFIFLFALPALLRVGTGFWVALAGAAIATVVGYFGYVWVLRRIGFLG